jgi:nucleoside transporter
MRNTPSKAWTNSGELAALFFLQMLAGAMWLVPLSRILNANGYATLAAYAYATSAVAAFISPLVFGAMADRHASPVVVLRWLSFASAIGMALAGWSVAHGWPALVVLALIQLYALAASPITSLASTIIFSRLRDSQRQFGPIRAVGTFGWMCGCWLISLLNLDASAAAGYAGAIAWLGLMAFTFLLPSVRPATSGSMSLRERMGWDALALLKNRDHRVVFLTVALFNIPLAAFYPFTPPHMQQLGLEHTSAWMTLGQITEIIAMICLAGLFARWRLKFIFIIGLSVGVIRFLLCALDQKFWLLAGVTLHGFSFTLVFITGQIYLNERIEVAWRARAQALLSLLSSGAGNLVGYLGTGVWYEICAQQGGTRWTLFWLVLALAVAAVLLFFLIAYRGLGGGLRKVPSHDVSKATQPLQRL